MGTPPDILAETLRRQYAAAGLHCEYRPFNSVADLPRGEYTLALIRFSLLLDHYATVLEVGDQTVTLGDPLTGRQVLTHEAFATRWRRVGVVLGREAR
jgi:hypothetical protein